MVGQQRQKLFIGGGGVKGGEQRQKLFIEGGGVEGVTTPTPPSKL